MRRSVSSKSTSLNIMLAVLSVISSKGRHVASFIPSASRTTRTVSVNAVSTFGTGRSIPSAYQNRIPALASSGISTTAHRSSSQSSSPSAKIANSKKSKKNSNTGGLRKLPVVKPPVELISGAHRTAYFVRPDEKIKNSRNRARKHGAETLDAVTKSLCLPIRDVVDGYKRELRRLHPFERVVADLTAKAQQKKNGSTLLTILDDLHEARKEILLSGKDWIAACKNAETARDANDRMREGEQRLCELFEELAAKPLLGLLNLQKALRTTPAVKLDTPAVVLVGAPNVGKSSIVRAISSGTPEVNNYPFTTRGMTLGHVEVFWDEENQAAQAVIPEAKKKKKRRDLDDRRIVQSYAYSQLCQVMDSPGLLVRPDLERNEMEALTLAAMQHLPTAVMYVMDLSGEAGDRCSSIEHQLQLRKEVRARFPRRPWIDIVSKVDMGLVDGVREDLEQILDGDAYLDVSIHEGTGVEQLSIEVMRMLGEVRLVLDAMSAVDVRSARTNP